MARYIGLRLIQGAITVLGISVLIFSLSQLSGNPADLLLDPSTPEETRDAFIKSHGLDKPAYVQYFHFIQGAVQGDFGESFIFGRSSLDVFLQRFPNTLQLALAASLVALTGGVLVGVLGAVRMGGIPDRIATIAALLGQSIPSFWIAILMIMLFSVQLGWLPTAGKGGFLTYIMPAVSLAWFSLAALMRMTRSSMLDVMDTEYVKLARLKGLPERTVIWKHAFRNALMPVLTLFSLQLIFFVSGSVIIENIFAWPGIGQLTIQAISSRDYPLVQTIVLITSTFLVIVNLAVDILYAYIDPRIRYA